MTLEKCDGGCKECLLQGPDLKGYLKKIVSTMRNGGVIADRAGEMWLQRGGAISSKETQEEDFKSAEKAVTREICGELRNGPKNNRLVSEVESDEFVFVSAEG